MTFPSNTVKGLSAVMWRERTPSASVIPQRPVQCSNPFVCTAGHIHSGSDYLVFLCWTEYLFDVWPALKPFQALKPWSPLIERSFSFFPLDRLFLKPSSSIRVKEETPQTYPWIKKGSKTDHSYLLSMSKMDSFFTLFRTVNFTSLKELLRWIIHNLPGPPS